VAEVAKKSLKEVTKRLSEWVVSRPEILRLVIDLTRNDKKQDDTYMNQSVSRVIFTCYIKNFQLLVPRYVLLPLRLYRTGYIRKVVLCSYVRAVVHPNCMKNLL